MNSFLNSLKIEQQLISIQQKISMNQLLAEIKNCTRYSLYSIIKKVVPALKKLRWSRLKENENLEKRANIISLLVQKFKEIEENYLQFSKREYFKYCLRKFKDQDIEALLMSSLNNDYEKQSAKVQQNSNSIIPKMGQILETTFCPTCTKFFIKNLPFHIAEQKGHQIPLFVRDLKSIHEEQLTKIICALGNQSKGTIIITKSHLNSTPISGFQKSMPSDQKSIYSMLQNSLQAVKHIASTLKIRVQKVHIMSQKQYIREKEAEKRSQQQKKKQNQKKQSYTSKFATNSNKQKSILLKNEEYVFRINVEAKDCKRNRIFYKKQKSSNKNSVEFYALEKKSQKQLDNGDFWGIRKFQGEDMYLRLVRMGNRRAVGNINQHNCSFFDKQKDEIEFCPISFPKFQKAYKQPPKSQKKQPPLSLQPYKPQTAPAAPTTPKQCPTKSQSQEIFSQGTSMGSDGLPNFNYSHTSIKKNHKIFKSSSQNCKMIQAHPYSSSYTCIKLGGGTASLFNSLDLVKFGNQTNNNMKQNQPALMFESKHNDVYTKCTIKKTGNGYLETKSILESQFHWVQTEKKTDCVMKYKETIEVQFYSNEFEKQTMPKYQYTNNDSIKYI